MSSSVRELIENPAQRRKLLAIVSGALILAALAAEHVAHLATIADGLMIAAALIAGADIAKRAWASLRNRYASIELLVTIATAGAVIIGEYWEAAAVTFLFIFGAYLEARTLSRTRQALRELLDLAPATALVLRDGRQVEVMPYEVEPGETVVVKPGTRVPVDGEVSGGHAAVDESPITGESMPVEKERGARVYAGTVSQDGLLYVHATGVGADTTLARIIRRVEEAQEEKAPTQRFIERFARWYTPAIIGLSAVVWLITRDVELALTLLVIGCPGALVISTPVSVVAGIGRAAQRGILIKGGEYLENAGKISALALDKTGTLTQGKPRLTDIVTLHPHPQPLSLGGRGEKVPLHLSDPSPLSVKPSRGGLRERVPLQPEAVVALTVTDVESRFENVVLERTNGRGGRGWNEAQWEVLRWAAVAEAGSEHPLARPILAEAEHLGPVVQAETFETLTGRGVRAAYQGHVVGVGTIELMAEMGVPVAPEAEQSLARLKSDGKTAVLVAVDGVAVGILGIADMLRDEAAAAIQQLKASGLRRIVMLTGDDRRTADAIARQAGVEEVHAGLLPEDKLTLIRELQRAGHVVAMIGDGINDAPALAAADIGIAMGAAGTDVAIETADIALMADDLTKVAEATRLSRATLWNIRQNVAIALVTVAGLLAGVLLGEVHMAGGMLIHEVSVLVVIINGMRLLRA